ncbi:MAG TPA: type II secretion system F family protein [Phycisphaerales bacterium]|nr:type II secretion system F family protein [Phycisphaerales bacterium]
MPSYRYSAVTPGGEKVAGVLAGASEQAVLAELDARRLVPVRLEAEDDSGPLLARRLASARELATAYTQLADLLRAGVPLLRGLRLLGAQKARPRLARVFSDLADAVAEGTDLAHAMSQEPEVFAGVHVAMVRAGEKGGFLDEVLARLGEMLLSQAELRAKVLGNLVYPAVLVVVGTVVLGLVFGVFLPMFRQVFDQLELGLLTRAVLATGDAVRAYGLLGLAGVLAAGVWLWRVSKRPAWRARLARARLRAPLLGPVTRALAVARFCRTLGTMLANSIPMLTAMQIARDAAGNPLMEHAIDQATDAVRHGQPLAPPLARSGLFPEDIVEMIAVGESANNLDSVLLTIARTAESRVERLLGTVVRLIEPLMLVALALIIGVVAMALILPITQISQGID